jgi:predicted flap endonuclease-1-like 5' DNA nuclease
MIQEIIGIIGGCLLVAFAAGAVIGWLIKHLLLPATTGPSVEAKKLETDLSAARKECVECLKNREELETRIKSLEGELAKKKASALTDDAPIVIKAEPPSASSATGTVTYETSNFMKAPEVSGDAIAAVAAGAMGIAADAAEKSGEALGLVAEYDNLEEIYGVGPKLATLLHGLGITRFKQIAQWTDGEIDRVDAHLAEFQGRIRRENWVQSARECHFKKYGEWL